MRAAGSRVHDPGIDPARRRLAQRPCGQQKPVASAAIVEYSYLKVALQAIVLQSVVAHKVVVRVRHDGAIVRVVLDELPDVPSSVFVIAAEGSRAVASVDALALVDLALEPLPQP